jgi:hypothetical protein
MRAEHNFAEAHDPAKPAAAAESRGRVTREIAPTAPAVGGVSRSAPPLPVSRLQDNPTRKERSHDPNRDKATITALQARPSR